MTSTTNPNPRILGTGIQEGLLLKPVTYPWAYDLYNQAVANTWFPHEVQLGEDLSEIAKGTDRRDIVRQLLSWAYEQGRFQELLDRLAARHAPTT